MMAGYQDFLNQHLAVAGRGREAGNANVGDGTAGPAYRSPSAELAALISYLVASGGVIDGGGAYPGSAIPAPAIVPTPPVSGAIPGVNPNPSINPQSTVFGGMYGLPQTTYGGNAIDGDGTAGSRSHRSEVNALVDDLKNRASGKVYEDGSQDPNYQYSYSVPRPAMNSIQNAAALALARMKGK